MSNSQFPFKPGSWRGESQAFSDDPTGEQAGGEGHSAEHPPAEEFPSAESGSAESGEAAEEAVAADAESAEEPQFGLVEVIEAFTAMRHEWRGQTKETRELAESLQKTAESIGAVESRLAEHLNETTEVLSRALAENSADAPTGETQQLVERLIEIDHQLTRAIEAVRRAEASRLQQERAYQQRLERLASRLNPIAKWFARPLLVEIDASSTASLNADATESSAIEGLNLVASRLRRSLSEHQIERIDTLGMAFDPSSMSAIGTVESDQYPAGHVAEQVVPGYRWRGECLRFAEVRVVGKS